MTSWVGVDIGGTFTDVIVYDASARRLLSSKTLSDKVDPVQAVLDGLAKLDVDLAETSRFVHGTTRVTNALLEGDRVPVALLTTRGFRDVVAMGRGHRPRLYSVKERPPEKLVGRPLRIEVDERIVADGTVMTPLDDADVMSALDSLPPGEIAGVAVCFLHAYANPVHEQRAAELIAAHRPDLVCSASSEVVPEIGEYERFVTTVLNVAVKPFVDTYLSEFEGKLRDRGYGAQLFIMTSSGGVVLADQARRLPVQLALSGPAGGVAASSYVARRAGYPNIITCDMGGTSTDVCLIQDGVPTMTNQGEIGGWPNRTFQIEIQTIGAGGGSIAWRDIGGELCIGPESAGSTPGPACYGRGGKRPTITDAHLIVGHLDAGTRLGDEVTLDLDAARTAMQELAVELGGIAVEELALGILRLANAKMTSAIKAISIARGHDPRDFVLLPFGGAGPMHAAMLADELGIDEILVPPVPGNLSALGFVTAQARQDMVRTMPSALDATAIAAAAAAFEELAADGAARMAENGLTDPSKLDLRRSVGMRIKGQTFELIVPLDGEMPDVAGLEQRFRAAYEARYAYAPPGGQLEIVSCRLTVLGPVPDVALGGAAGEPSGPSTRPIYTTDGWQEAHVQHRSAMEAGRPVAGPAIVTESGATTVVGAGWTAEIDGFENLILRRRVDETAG